VRHCVTTSGFINVAAMMLTPVIMKARELVAAVLRRAHDEEQRRTAKRDTLGCDEQVNSRVG
jgi:hypothetical protein